MSISVYLGGLRRHVGHALLMMPGVAAVIRDERGRLLLHRRHDDGTWDVPGGGVDPGELPARALAREVEEETGLIVRPTRLLALLGGEPLRRHYPNGDVVEYMTALFACEPIGGELQPADGEALELRWFDDAELEAVATPLLRLVLAAAAAGTPGPASFQP